MPDLFLSQTSNHQGRTIENKFVFSDVDEDWRDGPWGSRGTKKKLGKEILPLLTDSDLYKEFYNLAWYSTTRLILGYNSM